MVNAVKKILVIRFSSIGDIVLTSPVIRCLKEQIKGAEIHFLAKKQFVSILEANPNLSKVYGIENNVFEVIASLKRENYNYVIDLHNNLRSAHVKLLLRKPSSSFSKLNTRKWLLVSTKYNTLPSKHVVDRYLETAKQLHVVNDNKGLDYFIPPKDEVEVGTLPPVFSGGYVGFVIGAKHNTKKLPIEKIISFCRKINSPIILLGGKEDQKIGDQIKQAVGENIYNACGKYTLNQSASLVRQSKKIITHDTGLMHIAAAFKKEIISIWGSTVPQFGMSPYLPNKESKILEVKNLSCRPCSKIGYSSCPKGHFDCMNKIEFPSL